MPKRKPSRSPLKHKIAALSPSTTLGELQAMLEELGYGWRGAFDLNIWKYKKEKRWHASSNQTGGYKNDDPKNLAEAVQCVLRGRCDMEE